MDDYIHEQSTNRALKRRSVMAAGAALAGVVARQAVGPGTVDARAPGDVINVNDFPSIQAALDHAGVATGARVYIPKGVFTINETLKLTNARGVTIVGDGRYATRLQWSGRSNGDVIQLINCYQCGIESLSVFGYSQDAGRPDSIVNSIENTNIPTTLVSSRHVFRDLDIGGDGLKMANFGMRVSRAGVDQNNDGHLYDNINVANVVEACFQFEHSQGREHVLLNCITQGAKRAVSTIGGGGGASNFTWIGGQANGMTEAAFDLGSPVGPITIIHCLAEECRRFLQTVHGSLPLPVTLQDCNMYSSRGRLAPDRKIILYRFLGPLTIRGGQIGFGGDKTNRPLIAMESTAGDAAVGAEGRLIVEGVAFGNYTSKNEDPIVTLPILPNGPNALVRITRSGNVFTQDGEGWGMREDNTILGAIAGVVGISATPLQANNLRGQLMVSGAQVTGKVNFATAEPDHEYRLAVTAVALNGTPAPGSNRVMAITKSATGFTVFVEVAPGSNNSVTFDWLLLR